MQTFNPDRIIRAFREAPWRRQIQIVAALSVGLVILLVLGSLYLAVAARAANAGRDLQKFEAGRAELAQANNELRAQLADLRSMDRMAARALELGFLPANPEQVEYVAVPNFPPPAQAAPVVVEAAPAPQPASLVEWLGASLRSLAGGGADD